MPTKSEIVDELDAIDARIAELDALEIDDDPGHDLYRAVLFGYCIDCGHRYVDMGPGETCSTCRSVTDWLLKYKEKHPWASEKRKQTA